MKVYCYDYLLQMMIRIMLLGILLLHCASENWEKAPNYKFIHQATSAPLISYYDYIIVGGGTAGCPLATTLSEHYNVLLLERGGSPYGNPNITEIEGFLAPLSDLSLSSPSQQFISEDGVINARARVLGGGTSINGGFYSRAEESFVKEAGWDGQLVNESYIWVENKIVFESVIGEWQSAIRDGLLEVGVLPYNNFTYDHLVGTKVGGSLFDRYGTRHTSADLLQYGNPNRLTVLLNATVGKILFSTKGKSKPLARGVLFKDSEGREHRAYLKSRSKSEVIISAGTLGSPQLLMLSGIGPEDHLKSLNISIVLNHKYVGQYMKDNPGNLVFVESPVPVELSLPGIVGITRSGNYIEAASGSRLNDQYATTANSPEECASTPEGGVIFEKFFGPISNGHLELKNLDPADNPRVTFNYFQHREDLKRCVNGMRVVLKVALSKSLSKFRYENVTIQELLNIVRNNPANLIPNKGNNITSLEQFCKETVVSWYHYHGGCRVGKVVDRDYKVIGVEGLRVIDSSTFHRSPGTNPQATVLMLGRYMGVMIHKERIADTNDYLSKSIKFIIIEENNLN